MSHIVVALKYNCHDDKANLILSTNKHKTLFFILLYSDIKDGLPYLFHSFRNKYFNKISLGNVLYFQNKL